LVAALAKAMNEPSAEIAGCELAALPNAPPVLTLMIVVTPIWRSRRKMSREKFESPGTRFCASLSKATKRPSSEIAPCWLIPLGSKPPAPVTLMRSSWPFVRSRTNTSVSPAVSPFIKSLARLWNTTKRPSGVTAELCGFSHERPFAVVPLEPRLAFEVDWASEGEASSAAAIHAASWVRELIMEDDPSLKSWGRKAKHRRGSRGNAPAASENEEAQSYAQSAIRAGSRDVSRRLPATPRA
jgi:hypothetical protein